MSPAGETSDADAQTQNGSLPGNDDVESDIPVSAGLTEAVATAEDSHVKVLAPQERALLRLILKFGMMALGEDFGSDEGGAPIKVIDFVRDDLSVDNMHFSNPVYQRIYEEALALRESSWDNDLKVRIEKASIQQEAILKEGRDEIGKSARTMEEINIAEKKLQEKATVVSMNR